MSAKPEYRFGRILWEYVRASTRNRRKEQHPAVIISPNAQIIQPQHFDRRKNLTEDNVVAVVGVSTKFRNYPNQQYVELPSRPGGHPETGLKSECAAIIGWYDIIVIPDEVSDVAGQVPDRLMAEIGRLVRADIRIRLGKDFCLLGEAVQQLLFPTKRNDRSVLRDIVPFSASKEYTPSPV